MAVADAPDAGSLSSNGAKSEGNASRQPNEKEIEPSVLDKVKSLKKQTTSKVEWEKERRELKEYIADLESAVTDAHSQLSKINELLA
ncbi:uncharacterized protein N7483_007502 [Penicillium malachiteum]|uniref:uncharacterized protein n=1 Tax=Penicillium malachiteum TaxID=1324776 RepID=UPI0025482279|nr:uncharacterized protein N7483_007502 [Penicillium malachiteum]KAJ5726145.1 hypothetical protein N7483_007502 [Penicillium malachiteum]